MAVRLHNHRLYATDYDCEEMPEMIMSPDLILKELPAYSAPAYILLAAASVTLGAYFINRSLDKQSSSLKRRATLEEFRFPLPIMHCRPGSYEPHCIPAKCRSSAE